jgi:hypothetical protein
MSIRYDAIVIGTGQAGPALASRLSAAGMKVAIVERGAFGGTCVNTGCIPTKTLVASAAAASAVRHAPEFGVSAGGPLTVDMKAVKARKDAIAGDSRDGVGRAAPTAAPHSAPITIRAMNCGGALRDPVFGSLSLASSPSAATLKIHGVTAAPRKASGVPWRFSQPRRAAQLTAAGAAIARSPAESPIRNART